MNVGRGCLCAEREADAVDRGAFALFAAQAETWDILEAAARMEWDADPALRGFWRRQVRIVLEAIGRGVPDPS